MVDIYSPPGAFADISGFVADTNAINSATKTSLNLALNNISGLFGVSTGVTNAGIVAAHPDFNKVSPAIRQKIQNEIAVLVAAVTAHA